MFPELAHRGFHIAGGSFGVFLAPLVAAFPLDKSMPDPVVPIDLNTITISGAFIDLSYSISSFYDVLCAGEEQYLNTTDSAHIAAPMPACEGTMQRWRLGNDRQACAKGLRHVGKSSSSVIPRGTTLSMSSFPTLLWVSLTNALPVIKKLCRSFPTCSPYPHLIETCMNDVTFIDKIHSYV